MDSCIMLQDMKEQEEWGKMMIGENPEVRQGGFEIYHLEEDYKVGEPITENFNNILYVNCGSLADDWASIGITYREITDGRNVLFIRNPNDTFTTIEK